MGTVLQTNNLSKNYGYLKAVDNISIKIKKGYVYGILGPNGSGKSTTLGMILNVVNKTSGNFQWFDTETDNSKALKKIAENAGINGPVIVEQVQQQEFEIGYNAAKNTFVNMYEEGIVDPAKVTRSGLQNAASIASMVLTTECIIVEKKK